MSTPLQTFSLYFYDILDNLLPAEAPERATLIELFGALNDKPLSELGAEMSQLFTILAHIDDSSKMAIQLGMQVPLTAYSPVAMPMKFAPTIGASVKYLCDFIHVAAPLVALEYTPDPDGATVTIVSRETMPAEAEDLVALGAMVALAVEIGAITGKRSNFSAIDLRNCPKDAVIMFRELLNITPKTGGDYNRCHIPTKVLQTPNPFADRLSFERHVAQMKELEQAQRSTASITAQVRERLMSKIETPPRFDDLAASMSMSARQLRFALAKERTSYRELLQECRVDYARAQLSNPRMSISKLAHQLGYTDVTAFNHGFKRWTGMSPTQFQAMLKSGQTD